MSDEELWQAYAARSWEQRLENAGLALGLLASIGCFVWLYLTVGAVGWEWFAAIPACLIMGVTAGAMSASAWMFLVNLRRFPYAKTLEYRYGMTDLSVYLWPAWRRLRRTGGSNHVLFLSGTGLPLWTHTLVQIELSEETLIGRIRYRSGVSLHQVDAEPEFLKFFRDQEFALTRDDAAELLAFLSDTPPAKLRSVRHSVIDGFPCAVAWMRGGRLPVTASCNLAGLPPKLAVLPAPALMELILRIASRYTTGVPPARFGWSNPMTGDMGVSRKPKKDIRTGGDG